MIYYNDYYMQIHINYFKQLLTETNLSSQLNYLNVDCECKPHQYHSCNFNGLKKLTGRKQYSLPELILYLSENNYVFTNEDNEKLFDMLLGKYRKICYLETMEKRKLGGKYEKSHDVILRTKVIDIILKNQIYTHTKINKILIVCETSSKILRKNMDHIFILIDEIFNLNDDECLRLVKLKCDIFINGMSNTFLNKHTQNIAQHICNLTFLNKIQHIDITDIIIKNVHDAIARKSSHLNTIINILITKCSNESYTFDAMLKLIADVYSYGHSDDEHEQTDESSDEDNEDCTIGLSRMLSVNKYEYDKYNKKHKNNDNANVRLDNNNRNAEFAILLTKYDNLYGLNKLDSQSVIKLIDTYINPTILQQFNVKLTIEHLYHIFTNRYYYNNYGKDFWIILENELLKASIDEIPKLLEISFLIFANNEKNIMAFINKYNFTPTKKCLDNLLQRTCSMENINYLLSYKIIPDEETFAIFISNADYHTYIYYDDLDDSSDNDSDDSSDNEKVINISRKNNVQNIIELFISHGLLITHKILEIALQQNIKIDNLDRFGIKYDEHLYFICYKISIERLSMYEFIHIDPKVVEMRNLFFNPKVKSQQIKEFLKNNDVKPDRYCIDVSYSHKSRHILESIINLKYMPSNALILNILNEQYTNNNNFKIKYFDAMFSNFDYTIMSKQYENFDLNDIQ